MCHYAQVNLNKIFFVRVANWNCCMNFKATSFSFLVWTFAEWNEMCARKAKKKKIKFNASNKLFNNKTMEVGKHSIVIILYLLNDDSGTRRLRCTGDGRCCFVHWIGCNIYIIYVDSSQADVCMAHAGRYVRWFRGDFNIRMTFLSIVVQWFGEKVNA